MPTFEIPDGPTDIEGSRTADASATYSVTNKSSEALDGRLSVAVAGSSSSEWFTIDGNRERTFAPGETQTATIRVRFPADAAGGNYPFRLRAVAVNDPDNDHAEGPMTTVKLAAGETKKSWLWLWILLGVLALLAIGGGLYFALKKTEPPVVNVPEAPPQPKFDTAQALSTASKKTDAWVQAWSQKDIETLVNLSDPPFSLDKSDLLTTKYDIRIRYRDILANMRPHAEAKFDKITPYTIADFKKKGLIADNDPTMTALKLTDNDIVVVAMAGDEGSVFFFRRSNDDVQLAGMAD
jgi:hypothetical protein